MKFAGLLEAGRIDGVLTESKWVKGTYIAVDNITDMSLIPRGVKTAGTKCYLSNGSGDWKAGEYIWDGIQWKYAGPGITFSDLEKDNWHIYGRRKLNANSNAQWVQIDSTYVLDMIRDKLRAELDTVYAQKSEFDAAVNDLREELSTISGDVKELEKLQNHINEIDEQLTTIHDKLNTIDGFDSRITTAETKADKAIKDAEEAKEAIDTINGKLASGDFTIQLATEDKIGGLKAAKKSSSEDKGEVVRYYVGITDEGDKNGYAYVDVKPGEAYIDKNTVDQKIWPNIKDKIDEETWGTDDKQWSISGGTAASLKAI